MDYSNWPQIQQNPNPNSDFSLQHAPNQSIGYTPNQIPDPYQQPSSIDSHSALFLPPQPRPPGVDPPYVAPPVAVNYVQQPICYEAQQGADAAAAAAASSAAYYPDPNVNWLAAIPQYDPTLYTAGVVSTPNPVIQPQWIPTWKKGPKKTKIVQSAWCEVCKIDCNSKGVLDQHKLGKKHLKNLQKLQAATLTISAPIVAAPISAVAVEPPTVIAAPPASTATSTILPVPIPVTAPASTHAPIIGPQERSEISKLNKVKKSRKKAAARTEDLETKRRKVLEGGAAVTAVRACHICNVVCNSDTVYNYHIAGQKHAMMAKKYALRA
ncbi:hypothetical protein C2S53_007526 [Perilla frutescens var. hirtella]|uniref:U1-type domain-containing protein n=1 Tax=Perilla frutescens var. hirtella TaxID=608512 RepID=A0AAD4JAS0_PERFH|nr:hypothetical protein C2S53_007526 [Perilla frutescens var. hirtella]